MTALSDEQINDAYHSTCHLINTEERVHKFARLIESALLAAHSAPVAPANAGMHASIYAKVWGDAGGGDAGRIALANYAYGLGAKALQSQPSAPVSAPDAKPLKHPQISLTAKQLREAADFINPDADDEVQMEEEVTLIQLPAESAPMDDDGKRMPAGLYAFITEYPEEGCIPLFDSDAAIAQGSV